MDSLLLSRSSAPSPSAKKTKTKEKSDLYISSSLSSSSSSVVDIGILWDVDGTLADSYELGFQSTIQVLKNYEKTNEQQNKNSRSKKGVITEKEYHEGTKYTTPRRLAWHVTGNPDDEIGNELAREFDRLYIDLVTMDTAKFYPNIKDLLSKLYKYCDIGRDQIDIKAKSDGEDNSHLSQMTNNKIRLHQGALSNACGEYVCKVLSVNEVSNLFKCQLGADDVPKAKPEPDGLYQCCKEIGNILPQNCIYIGDSPTGM